MHYKKGRIEGHIPKDKNGPKIDGTLMDLKWMDYEKVSRFKQK